MHERLPFKVDVSSGYVRMVELTETKEYQRDRQHRKEVEKSKCQTKEREKVEKETDVRKAGYRKEVTHGTS